MGRLRISGAGYSWPAGERWCGSAACRTTCCTTWQADAAPLCQSRRFVAHVSQSGSSCASKNARTRYARRTAIIIEGLGCGCRGRSNLFRPFGTIEEAIARFRSIRGVGEWTAQYIALRALREMDAFPASDVGLLRGARLIDGMDLNPNGLLNRAELWRPWRAYAAQHLWAAQTVKATSGSNA